MLDKEIFTAVVLVFCFIIVCLLMKLQQRNLKIQQLEWELKTGGVRKRGLEGKGERK